MQKKFLLPSLAILLIAVYGFLLFYKIGNHPMIDWDEGIYAQIARQAIDQHSFIDLHWDGSISPQNPTGLWFEKPPLMFWLTESSFAVFGITEFAARFWSTLFALGVVILTYLLAKQLFKSEIVGIFSVVVYYLVHYFITQAWYLKFDIPVTFFILASFLAFNKATENKKYYLLFWACLGLGVLTKSIIGLMPLPIIFIQSLVIKNFSYLKERFFYYGLLIFFAVILPWHIVESLRYGKAFWSVYLGLQVLERFVQPIDNNNASFFYYFNNMRENWLFLGLSILSILYFVYKIFKKNSEKKPYIFLLISAFFIFLLFSTSVTKLASYILVVYPFLIVITAKSLSDLFQRFENKYFKFIAPILLAIFCITTGIIYNQSKINNNGYYAHYYYENKMMSQFVVANFPNLPVLLNQRDEPSIIFYLNERIYGWSKNTKISPGSFILFSQTAPDYQHVAKLAQGLTTGLYLVTIP